MFREMRRAKQRLSQADCLAVLDRGTSGVLALAGDGGYPYAVPLSYACSGGRLYFHCAKTGHKLDAIAREPKASFCVVDQDRVVSAEYTTYYRSVIAFGRCRVLEDEGERLRALELLCAKYAPDQTDHQAEIDQFYGQVCMVELAVEHLTGKEAIELVRARGEKAKGEDPS